MDTRKFWPFPSPIAAQETEETRREVSFLENANQEGHKAYLDEGGVLGAVAANGREGAMIPRAGQDRGLRRYWEVVLSQEPHSDGRFYVDGFEHAAEAVLLWLNNEQFSHIKSCLHEYIVQSPGK